MLLYIDNKYVLGMKATGSNRLHFKILRSKCTKYIRQYVHNSKECQFC